jgi:3-hydroxyacyl-CoA dehydrogenase
MTPEKGNLHPLIRMIVKAGYTGGKGEKGIYDFHTDVLKKSLQDKFVN